MPETAEKYHQPENIKPIRSKQNGKTEDPFEKLSQSSAKGVEDLNNSLQKAYQARIVTLEGNLAEADHKNRELMKEVFELKRELSQDKSQELLAHKEEITSLKENHRDTVEALKEQIRDLKQDLKINKMKEEMGGKRTAVDRVLDMVEENGGDFISNLVEGITKMAQTQGVSPQQLSSQQYNKVVADARQQTETEDVKHETEETPGQPAASNQNPESSTPQPDTATKIKQLSKEQMASVKEQIKDVLLKNAMEALTNNDANLAAYATQVRQQIQLNKQNGIQLDAKQWTEIAKRLAETAVEREISEERVTKVVQPALENVKNFAWMLKMVSPEKATEQLLNNFNIEAAPPVRNMVTKVLSAIQKSL